MQDFLELLKRGDAAAAEALLESHPELLTARNDQGASLLALSLYHGQPAIAQLFADRRPLDLWEACMLGNLPRVRDCLDADPASINLPAPDGFPPFALSVFFGQPAVYRHLLDRGADVNQPASNAMRVAAIHAAVSRKDTEGLALLLSRGADPNLRQQAGWTALHAAASAGLREIAEALLRAGADRHALTDKGETAASLALTAGHLDLAMALGP